MKEQMREALERIAKYPMTRSDDMSIETARDIARAALLAVPANHIPDTTKMVQSQANPDQIGDSNKLVQAVNALAVQTGESPESITEWLTDKGGLTTLMLSHFGGKEPQAQQEQNTDLIKQAVDKFLGWKLPKDFQPDCFINFDKEKAANHWPIGTNLLTAEQAKAMFEFCLQSQAQQPAQEPVSEAVPWTYGANEFKDWCSHWFGVDADESYLSKAIHDLPPMAQNFKRSHSQQPVKQESWISVEERLPEVKAESCGFFLVTAINLQTQKKSVFEAAFLNEMELYSDGHDLQLFSGWHSAKESKDYDGWYEPLGNEYCKVTHWMVMPLPPTPE